MRRELLSRCGRKRCLRGENVWVDPKHSSDYNRVRTSRLMTSCDRARAPLHKRSERQTSVHFTMTHKLGVIPVFPFHHFQPSTVLV
jgi:hypothetical protein